MFPCVMFYTKHKCTRTDSDTLKNLWDKCF